MLTATHEFISSLQKNKLSSLSKSVTVWGESFHTFLQYAYV